METDATGATEVPGLYAAGNVSDPSQQVLAAAATGWPASGGMISFSLAHNDIPAAARPSANEADWDHRYGGEQIWSGNPNGTLVNEIAGLTAGRALDVGAGEGGDALWLAEQGWSVTASDISRRRALGPGSPPRPSAGGCPSSANTPMRTHSARSPSRPSTSSRRSTRRLPRAPDSRGVRNVVDTVAPAARCSSSATTSSRCARRSTR